MERVKKKIRDIAEMVPVYLVFPLLAMADSWIFADPEKIEDKRQRILARLIQTCISIIVCEVGTLLGILMVYKHYGMLG